MDFANGNVERVVAIPKKQLRQAFQRPIRHDNQAKITRESLFFFEMLHHCPVRLQRLAEPGRER